MLRFSTTLLFMIVGIGAALAQPWSEPARGSRERQAIMDAIRPAIEARLNPPIEFVVKQLRVLDGWAFAQVVPQRPGGKPIDVRGTMLAEQEEGLDGLHTEAILQRRGQSWFLIDHAIGAGDVWFLIWCDRLPRRLLLDYCVHR